MRLLHCTRLDFEEFFDSNIPKYAILSHRREHDEVTLEDFIARRRRDGAGYRKIQQCCELATSEGYEWIWIDTCCIDKKSSAELSEAINSMYRWYQQAQVCFVYLLDVSSVEGEWSQCFQDSKWFTRGWTLQELLAPALILFYDQMWRPLGTKSSLTVQIHAATGINRRYLTGRWPIKWASIAERMSWAAGRTTSRVEDIAYCLLGIFDVNMPLLYGEGRKAFYRLQEEMIRHTEDDSIFAWSGDENSGSLLASSPNQFKHSGLITNTLFNTTRPSMITSSGLQMSVPLIKHTDHTFLLPLQCINVGADTFYMALKLKPVSGSRHDRFVRINLVYENLKDSKGERDFDGENERQTVYLQLRPQGPRPRNMYEERLIGHPRLLPYKS